MNNNYCFKVWRMSLLLVLCWMSGMAMAQTITTGPMTRVATGESAFYPQLTHDGTAVLVTQQNYTGLTSIDLATRRVQVLSTAPRAGRNAQPSPVRTNQNLQLELTLDGQTTILTPNGANERYLWPQLSPDGSKLVYGVSGRGTYVLDLATQAVTFVGKMRAARWFDNQWLVAMQDQDDGYEVTASAIVMTNLDGSVMQVLTDDSVKAMYPSAQAGRVAFNTADGQVYVMTVSINP